MLHERYRNKHLRSLEVLGEDTNQDVSISMVRDKLLEDVLLQAEFLKGAKVEWTVEKLRNLDREKSEKKKDNRVHSVRSSAVHSLNIEKSHESKLF